MGNPEEVIVLALKDFAIGNMNYQAGNKYALAHEAIATLEEGTVEIVPAVAEENTATETIVVPADEVVTEQVVPTPETPAEVNQVSPAPETPAVDEDPAQVEPTPAVVEEVEAKPWAGNHEVAK